LGDRYWEARGLDELADVHEAVGDTAWAQELRRVALDLLQSLCHPDADRVRSKLA
jgi:hypothetical protein